MIHDGRIQLVGGSLADLKLPDLAENEVGVPNQLGALNGVLRRAKSEGVFEDLPPYLAPPGQVMWDDPGVYSWTVPDGVYSICAVCVGAGAAGIRESRGGKGGDLRYGNFLQVTPGETLTIIAGAGGKESGSNGGRSGHNSLIRRGSTDLLVASGGGRLGSSTFSPYIGGGNGGMYYRGSGGGAGGYSGDGGRGRLPGTGGGAGGGGSYYYNRTWGGGGGGVGLMGEGTSGASGGTSSGAYAGGHGGSGGTRGSHTRPGNFGGGAGDYTNDGGKGGVRIIWGEDRHFPNTNTGDV